ncbi:hypothetical protein D3C78_1427450 [compost metagenome]
MPNSSPPSRARVSSSRRQRCRAVQSWRSSSSPAACPQVSLTSLNWSRSRYISACRSSCCAERCSARSRRSSNSWRLVSPVRASWEACQDSLSMYWCSRVTSWSTSTAPAMRALERIGVITRFTATRPPSARRISLADSLPPSLSPRRTRPTRASSSRSELSPSRHVNDDNGRPRTVSPDQPSMRSADGLR